MEGTIRSRERQVDCIRAIELARQSATYNDNAFNALDVVLLVQRVYGIVAAAVIAADACKMSAVREGGDCERGLKRSSESTNDYDILELSVLVIACSRI